MAKTTDESTLKKQPRCIALSGIITAIAFAVLGIRYASEQEKSGPWVGFPAFIITLFGSLFIFVAVTRLETRLRCKRRNI